MDSREHANDDGISLVEVMIALVLLVAIILSLVPIITQSVASTRRNDAVASATQVLSSQMGALKARTWTCGDLTALTSSTSQVGPQTLVVNVSRGAGCPETTGSAVGTVLVCMTVTTVAIAPGTCTKTPGIGGNVLASASTRIAVTG